jgi:hypothetical protein
MDHNMVLSYDYSNQNRRRRQTNAPPSRAILMAMAVRRCHTEHISQCSMTRASRKSLDAAIGQLLAPYCPGGRQGDSKQNDDATCTHFAGHFDGRGDVAVLYRAHCPMEEVCGFHKSH